MKPWHGKGIILASKFRGKKYEGSRNIQPGEVNMAAFYSQEWNLAKENGRSTLLTVQPEKFGRFNTKTK